MKNLCVKKLLVLYFILTLFFVKIGISNTVVNCAQNNQYTNVEKIVNYTNSPLLAVGTIAGEIVAGFTLAEVLITLLIIGIIASIVIPALIADTQEQELKTAWKKAFAEINGAVKMQFVNEGSVYAPTLKNYMNVVHDCSVSQTLPECAMNCPNSWWCNGKPTSSGIFITADGMQWGDFQPDKWCIVDVNGIKGPNKANKDVFVFCIMPDGKVFPDGNSNCPMGYSPNAVKWLSQ